MFLTILRRLIKTYSYLINDLITPFLKIHFENSIRKVQMRINSSFLGRWLYNNLPPALEFAFPDFYNFLLDLKFFCIRHQKFLWNIFAHYVFLGGLMSLLFILWEWNKKTISHFLFVNYAMKLIPLYHFLFPSLAHYSTKFVEWLKKRYLQNKL
uniref:hypothetical protein n=1 Tax=Bakuella subtropica TaxID=1295181 RepID=UPI0023F09B32|nr:hypothetical protein P4D19_mgp06 [Bakuella subtropica]WDY80895.1 hypothetical protein BKSUB_58 [Bakuella subtropica]